MRNHEVVNSHNLLDENGHLIEPGWSKTLVQKYDRNMIKNARQESKNGIIII